MSWEYMAFIFVKKKEGALLKALYCVDFISRDVGPRFPNNLRAGAIYRELMSSQIEISSDDSTS